MLEIKVIMNSSSEDVLAFKTCCSLRVWDQNLEIRIKNRGSTAVVIPSYFDLETTDGTKRIETLMPNGDQRLEPGQFINFYCFMEEKDWEKATKITFYDKKGNPYSVDTSH